MNTAVFWAVVPCGLAEAYRYIRGTCCLYNQDNEVITRHLDDRGRNYVSKLPPDRTSQQPRRQPHSYSPPSDLISYNQEMFLRVGAGFTLFYFISFLVCKRIVTTDILSCGKQARWIQVSRFPLETDTMFVWAGPGWKPTSARVKTCTKFASISGRGIQTEQVV
jgi:hypothetical protein